MCDGEKVSPLRLRTVVRPRAEASDETRVHYTTVIMCSCFFSDIFFPNSFTRYFRVELRKQKNERRRNGAMKAIASEIAERSKVKKRKKI